jgi:transcriptional regulator with XRE-family HTH domain
MESKWNHIAARTVRDARVRAGITQRELALISGMKQPQIARIENGTTQPSIPTLGRVLETLGYELVLIPTRSENRTTALRVSSNIKELLQTHDENVALREWLVLLDDLYAVAPLQFPGLVSEPPPSTQDSRWDALIAATVEYVAEQKGVTVPAWTEEKWRKCEGWYFSGIASLAEQERVESPKPFAKRGVYLVPEDLTRV